MRRATLLIAALLAFAGFAVPSASASTASPNLKIVLIVGATGSVTPSYRSNMDEVAATATKYSTDITKIYSPNATWAAVSSALQGANIVVYMGHGNGFPSPYSSTLSPNKVDGFGLNAKAGSGDDNNTYYGESYISSQIRLAPNALVILSHLCYASGNSESGKPQPTLAVAKQRIDNFAAGFRQAGASTVIADGNNNPSYYLDALFTTHQTMDQLWRADPWSAGHVFTFASVRTPGDTALGDPNGLSGSTYTNFYRSMVVKPGTTTDDVIAGVPASVAPSTPSTYVAMTPVRLLDTRTGNGLGGAFVSAVPRTFAVAGRGGVPATATAVTGILTVTGSTSGGYVALGPLATATPSTSTLNFPRGDTRATGVTVTLGAGGTLSAVFRGSGGTTALVFDVTGYFTPDTSGATYVAMTPVRLLDTRTGNGLGGAFVSAVPRTFAVAGRGGVPATATAVTGILTVTGSTSGGYVALGPLATATPSTSTLNFPQGDTRATGVTVTLGAGGTLSAVFRGSGGTTALVFDVTGYFTPDTSGATYVAMTPVRLLDTRTGNGLGGAFVSAVPRTFAVAGRGGVPATATAVTGILTVTGSTSGGYVALGPLATATPSTSTLNFPRGDTRSNGVNVALGAEGVLSITSTATTQVVFDVTGYFVGP